MSSAASTWLSMWADSSSLLPPLLFTAAVGNPYITTLSLATAFLAFAGGGLALALRSQVLKPAGVALFGTSLAILPILGMPLDEAFIGHSIATWMVISLAGLAVYSYGAIVLDSRVLGYLVIPFLYSSIVSATAVLQPAIFWTLLGVIVLSTLVQVGVLLLGERIPQVLSKPFGQLHWVVVPGVLLASILLVEQMGAYDYASLCAVSAAYYLVTSGLEKRLAVQLACRGAGRVLALLAGLAGIGGAEVSLSTGTALFAVWTAVLYFAVRLIPGVSAAEGVTYPGWGDGAQLRRQDSLLMLSLALVVTFTGQVVHLVHADLWRSEHTVLASMVALMVFITTYALLSKRDSAQCWVIRSALVLSAVIAVVNHPYYTLFWTLVWILAEFRLSERADFRARWQRLAITAAAAAAGLTAGQLLDDAVVGQRLALAASMVAAAVIATVLSARLLSDRREKAGPPAHTRTSDDGSAQNLAGNSGGSRYGLEESWSYLALFLVLGLIGTSLFDLQVWMTPVYMAAVAAPAYALLTMTAGPTARTGRDEAPLLRGMLFAGVGLLGFLLLDLDYLRSAPDAAWAAAGIALVLVVAEAVSAVAQRRITQRSITKAELTQAGGTRGRNTQGSAQSVPASPVHRWTPLHLSANLAWLAGVNAVLASTGASGELYWFTAVSWAGVYAGFALAAKGNAARTATSDGAVYDRLISGVYALGVGLLAAAALLVPANPWWVHLATGAGALLVGVMLLVTLSAREESSLAAPLYAGLAGVLLTAGAMGMADPHQNLLIYLTNTGGFIFTAGLTVAGLIVLRGGRRGADPSTEPAVKAQVARRQLVITGGAIALLLSLTPMAFASMGEYFALAWLVPLMHLALVGGAGRFMPHPAALTGSLLVPFSMVWAWSRWQPVGEEHYATGLALMFISLLGWEVLLRGRGARNPRQADQNRPGQSQQHQNQQDQNLPGRNQSDQNWLGQNEHGQNSLGQRSMPRLPWAWGPVYYSTAGAITVVAAVNGLAAGAILVQLSPVILSALLVLAGTVRRIWIGPWIAGGLLAGMALLAPLQEWWFQLATGGAAALLVACGLAVLRQRHESRIAIPVFAVMAGGLLMFAPLEATGAHYNAGIYFGSLAAFLSVTVVAVTGNIVLSRESGEGHLLRRRQLGISSAVAGLAASLLPVAFTTAGDYQSLAWLVPLMHLGLAVAAGLYLPRTMGLAGSIAVPLSLFWAWSVVDVPTPDVLAACLITMVLALLSCEAVLLRKEERTRWQLIYYCTAGAITVLSALFGLLHTEDALPQLAPIITASFMVMAGVVRSARVGIYLGAAVIILAVLRWLSQWMFLFLVFLGALIIAAAVWRLIVMHRWDRGRKAPASHESL